MLNKTSKAFRAFILLQFTKELIKHTNSKVFEIVPQKQVPQQIPLQQPPAQIPRPTPQQRIVIPEQKLPPQFEYLRPTISQIQIDLGKLNPILKDPSVRSIECNGPDEPLITKGLSGVRKTNITLSKEEIDEIIDKFSKETKIPAMEGLFKVTLGGLVLSAIISEVVGDKFILNRIAAAPRGPPGFPPGRVPPTRGRF